MQIEDEEVERSIKAMSEAGEALIATRQEVARLRDAEVLHGRAVQALLADNARLRALNSEWSERVRRLRDVIQLWLRDGLEPDEGRAALTREEAFDGARDALFHDEASEQRRRDPTTRPGAW